MKYKCHYKYVPEFGNKYHHWIVIGDALSISLHIADLGEKAEGQSYERFSGGIELHYRYPPEYMKGDPPSHNHCSIIKCPCWHDGSSLQVSEYWIPLWRSLQNNHGAMFAHLEGELDRRVKEFNEET